MAVFVPRSHATERPEERSGFKTVCRAPAAPTSYKRLSSETPVEEVPAASAEEAPSSNWDSVVPLRREEPKVAGSMPSNWASSSNRDAVFTP